MPTSASCTASSFCWADTTSTASLGAQPHLKGEGSPCLETQNLYSRREMLISGQLFFGHLSYFIERETVKCVFCLQDIASGPFIQLPTSRDAACQTEPALTGTADTQLSFRTLQLHFRSGCVQATVSCKELGIGTKLSPVVGL